MGETRGRIFPPHPRPPEEVFFKYVKVKRKLLVFHLPPRKKHYNRGGTIGTKTDFLKVFKWILLSFKYIRTGKTEFLNLVTVLTLLPDPKNLKIPIIGSKLKIVVNFIYGYQNLSGEKYKTNEKKLAQSDLPVKRKIQTTTRKIGFLETGSFGWFFGFFF